MARIARNVGAWTIQKLEFLSEYLAAYVRATQRVKRADVCFMDLCVGPGFDKHRETAEVVEGSPLRALALYPGFRRFIFVDIDHSHTRQLRELVFERRLDNISHVLTGDCNLIIQEALQHAPKDGPTFCFVDPASIDVHWQTIAAIAGHKPLGTRKIELFVLFAYDMSLVRFLARDRRPDEIWGPEVEREIDNAMPDPIRWRRVYQDRNSGAINPRESRRRFAYMYWMGLKELGYKHVLRPKLLTSSRGNPLYFLFFASDHPVGDRIMSHILSRPRTFDQLSLPLVEDPWDFEEGETWYGTS